MNESRHTCIVIVFPIPTHDPVDTRDSELYTLRVLVFIEIHILEHQREDVLPITICSVELLDAVGGGEVFSGDDR